MTSPRRRQGRAVESVVLKVTIKADRKSLSRIKQAIPEASERSGSIEVLLEGNEPLQVAENAKRLSDRLKAALGDAGSKGLDGRRREPKSPKRL